MYKIEESIGSGNSGIDNQRLFTILNRLAKAVNAQAIATFGVAVASPDAVAAAGVSPVIAEFNAVSDIANELKAVLNACVVGLVTTADAATVIADPTMAEQNALVALISELIADVKALTGVAVDDSAIALSVNEPPTKAEFDPTVVAANALKAAFNTALAESALAPNEDAIVGCGDSSLELSASFV